MEWDLHFRKIVLVAGFSRIGKQQNWRQGTQIATTANQTQEGGIGIGQSKQLQGYLQSKLCG